MITAQGKPWAFFLTFGPTYFNTIRITMENPINSPYKTLVNRANAKFLTQELLLALVEIRKQGLADKGINRALGCGSFIKVTQDGLKSRFCGNRFCLVCNRIRTAQLYAMYETPLKALPDLHFVTLTIKNPTKDKLKGSIQQMYRDFKLLKDALRKQKVKLLGLRKLEITYNDRENTYHPHYHLIISGQYEAENLVESWLDYNETASYKAQNIKKADESALKELFKYFTKLKSNNSYSEKITISALNHIINSIVKVRIFQPIGIKAIKPPQKSPQMAQDEPEPLFYDWIQDNWYDATGAPLLLNFSIYEKTATFSQNFDLETV